MSSKILIIFYQFFVLDEANEVAPDQIGAAEIRLCFLREAVGRSADLFDGVRDFATNINQLHDVCRETNCGARLHCRSGKT